MSNILLSAKQRKMIWRISVFMFILLLIFSAFFVWFKFKSNKPPQTFIAEVKEKKEIIQEQLLKEEERGVVREVSVSEKKTKDWPSRVKIEVPFTSQAPFKVWDERHEEACEEASLIMIYFFLKGEKLSKEKAEEEIQKLTDFQLRQDGKLKDKNVAEVVQLAKEYYNLKNLEVVYDFEPEDIKKELAQGNPLIIPAAGRELKNPYFKAPGPLYHMLVLVGYSADNQIIANDPGTWRGEGYRYPLDVLYSAIHDFPGDKEKILEGRRAIIVVKRENVVK